MQASSAKLGGLSQEECHLPILLSIIISYVISACHPVLCSSMPEDIDDTAIVRNTRKSFAAWVLARSDGV